MDTCPINDEINRKKNIQGQQINAFKNFISISMIKHRIVCRPIGDSNFL